MRTDIEVAREARLRPNVEIAETVGLAAGDLHLYGHHIALGAPLGHEPLP